MSGLAALVYLASYGARTPLLALRGLLRLRNLAVLLVPAVGLGLLAASLQPLLGEVAASGAMFLVLAPAPLAAPAVLARTGGRMDLAGALALGTILLSALLIGSRAALGSGALFAALESYAIAAMVAGVLPMVRDRLLGPLGLAGLASATVILAVALVSGPIVDVSVVIAALAVFAVGVVGALLAAALTRRDVAAAIAGAGLRDPVLAVAFATAVSGDAYSSGVALVYGVFCLGLTALVLRWR